ncbi:MAG TPA: hypothetical protein VGN16_07505 [Acidobacteriaceae bacterium]
MQVVRSMMLAAVATLACGSALAQEIPMEGPVATTALVRAESKGGVPLDANALKLEVNGHGIPVESVTPVSRGRAEVAILIDDGLRTSFANQLSEVQQFVRDLPPGVGVLIGYMQNGSIRSNDHFSANHEEVLSTLRIPFSSIGSSASPYFCLSEFVKHWPSQQPAARFVLMLTNGVDPYNGSVSPLNQNSPYVERAQLDSQAAGVAVYSIYYGDRGERGGAVAFSGQGYLQQIASATGGDSFNNGTIAPPSISPYLRMFNRSIAESYLVSFRAPVNRRDRDDLARIKLKTSQSGVKIHAPDNVRVGLVE